MKQISKNIHSNAESEFRRLFSLMNAGDFAKKDFKLGVILEGGALRGVLSCSYARALRDVFPTLVFDAAYGSSSGGLNSVYFATNQLELATTIYIENATDKRCTNPIRFPNVLDVDWLIDNWLFDKKAFNVRKLRELTQPVTVSLTNMTDGSPVYADVTKLSDRDLRTVLKATSYAPLLTNMLGSYNGLEVGDGAVADALLYDKAIADGCTHIICLFTRQPAYRKESGVASRLFKKIRLLNRTPAYRAAFFQAEQRYNSVVSRIYSEACPKPTLVICPAGKEEIPSNIETRQEKIAAAAQLAYGAAKSQLTAWAP